VVLDSGGKATITVVAVKKLPDGVLAGQIALVGRAVWTDPGSGEVRRIVVTPGRVVTMDEKVLGKLKDFAPGFLWGDSENLAQMSGEIASGFVPVYGLWVDGRDVVREVARFLVPGGDDGSWLAPRGGMKKQQTNRESKGAETNP
jgi:hypothetical protein